MAGDEGYMGSYYIYEFEDHGKLYVEPRCSKCGRFIKAGIASVNMGGDSTRFKGFQCSRCGDTQPMNYFWM